MGISNVLFLDLGRGYRSSSCVFLLYKLLNKFDKVLVRVHGHTYIAHMHAHTQADSAQHVVGAPSFTTQSDLFYEAQT